MIHISRELQIRQPDHAKQCRKQMRIRSSLRELTAAGAVLQRVGSGKLAFASLSADALAAAICEIDPVKRVSLFVAGFRYLFLPSSLFRKR